MTQAQALAILQTAEDLYGETRYTGFYIYGSPNRPMSASWAKIEDTFGNEARFVNADYRTYRVHTFIVVPEKLDSTTIMSYELTSEPMAEISR